MKLNKITKLFLPVYNIALLSPQQINQEQYTIESEKKNHIKNSP